MYWLSVGFAGGSLVVSVAVLVLVWLGLQSARRTERSGEERLEMLREQRERLQFLHEERRTLEEELEWRRSTTDREGSLLEPNAPPQSNGVSEPEPPKLRA